jgi:hypothetical protein
MALPPYRPRLSQWVRLNFWVHVQTVAVVLVERLGPVSQTILRGALRFRCVRVAAPVHEPRQQYRITQIRADRDTPSIECALEGFNHPVALRRAKRSSARDRANISPKVVLSAGNLARVALAAPFRVLNHLGRLPNTVSKTLRDHVTHELAADSRWCRCERNGLRIAVIQAERQVIPPPFMATDLKTGRTMEVVRALQSNLASVGARRRHGRVPLQRQMRLRE